MDRRIAARGNPVNADGGSSKACTTLIARANTSDRAGLMQRGQRQRHHEQQRRDAQRELDRPASRAARWRRKRARGVIAGTRRSFHNSTGTRKHEQPRAEPVIELHGGQVPEEVLPRRLERSGSPGGTISPFISGNVLYAKPARRPATNPPVTIIASTSARMAIAQRRADLAASVTSFVRRGNKQRKRQPEHRAEDQEREREMRGQAELRDARVVDQIRS